MTDTFKDIKNTEIELKAGMGCLTFEINDEGGMEISATYLEPTGVDPERAVFMKALLSGLGEMAAKKPDVVVDIGFTAMMQDDSETLFEKPVEVNEELKDWEPKGIPN